jgi:putative ABC transport system permease protein
MGTLFFRPTYSISMLQNYFKIAIRNLQRNLRLLVINVTGLSIALAFTILSFLNYRFANTFDQTHPEGKNIVRVEIQKESNGEYFGSCPAALASAAPGQVAGIVESTTYDALWTIIKKDDQVFNEVVHFTDERFFTFFDFGLVSGVLNLDNKNGVIITEEIAEKYFGKDDPLGQSLMFFADKDQRFLLTITGVIKKTPLNSSLRFSFLIHRDNQPDGQTKVDYTSWKWGADAVFFKLRQPENRQAVAEDLKQFVPLRNTARPDWRITGFRLTPMHDMAVQARELRGNALWPGVPPAAVWGNIVTSLMLLLTAALNFANLTIASCNRRLREMGIRKVMGGSRAQLIRQLLSETLIVVVLSTIIGMALVYPLCDWFNATWKFTDLKVNYQDIQLLTYIGLVVGFTTLLAGAYPALYVSNFQPAKIFRGGVLFGGKNVFSKVMMGLQMVFSIIAIITSVSFAQNAKHSQTADLGFAYENVLQAWLQNEKSFRLFEQSVKNLPGITGFAGSNHLPGFGFTLHDIRYNGESREVQAYEVGDSLLQIMDFKLVAGSFPAMAQDSNISREVVVNEKFTRELCGGRNPIGETIKKDSVEFRITGVVRDFTTSGFNPTLSSVIYQVPPKKYSRSIIKMDSKTSAAAAMVSLEKEWKRLFPYTPFNVGYQDEMLREEIEVSSNVAYTMSIFALITIILTTIGLFSLISLEVLRRIKEVAVRRVMGASAVEISWILNRNLVWVVFFSIGIGVTAGLFFARLLMDSIFKTNYGVHANVLFWGGGSILLIILGTIAVKIWQTLRINPADTLRNA